MDVQKEKVASQRGSGRKKEGVDGGGGCGFLIVCVMCVVQGWFFGCVYCWRRVYKKIQREVESVEQEKLWSSRAIKECVLSPILRTKREGSRKVKKGKKKRQVR